MKNLKRRKYITLALSTALLISVSSVGFSTWIFSLEQKEQSFTTTINISSSWNATAMLDLQSTTTQIESDGKTEDSDILKEFNVPLDGSLLVANDIVNSVTDSSSKGGTLNYTIDAIQNSNDNKIDLNVITSNAITDTTFHDNTSDLKYFDISASIESVASLIESRKIVIDETNNIDGYTKYIIKLDEFKIKYGSYFNGENPEVFYQNQIDDLKIKYEQGNIGKEEYLNSIQQAKKELGDFKTAMNGKTININISLNFDDTPSQSEN